MPVFPSICRHWIYNDPDILLSSIRSCAMDLVHHQRGNHPRGEYGHTEDGGTESVSAKTCVGCDAQPTSCVYDKGSGGYERSVEW